MNTESIENAEEIILSIVMPCLNEVETLERCIRKARKGIAATGLPGEIVVADNGSTDGSVELARRLGARVVPVAARGYGSALRAGIEAALGRWVIIGDSDDSYDFSDLRAFVDKLALGFDLVMGCRLSAGGGRILQGAMPWKNRWIGNPALSFLGRLFFRSPVHDFHCGLRGLTREAFRRMELSTTGMEFASEMVMKASLKGLRLAEVPITLHKDGRSRPPHLRPWRDGWRHLRFMLIYSPKWLFLVPGAMLFLSGLVAMVITLPGPWRLGGITLDVGTSTVASMAMVLGFQLVAQALYAKVFAVREGLLPDSAELRQWFRYWSLEKGCLTGLGLTVVGIGLLAWAVLKWQGADFGPIDMGANLRRLIPSATLITLGLQTIFSSFHLSILGLRGESRRAAWQSEGVVSAGGVSAY